VSGDVENPPAAPTVGRTAPTTRSIPMRYTLPIHQNTEAGNGLSQEG
jgi:hypothetical protein